MRRHPLDSLLFKYINSPLRMASPARISAIEPPMDTPQSIGQKRVNGPERCRKESGPLIPHKAARKYKNQQYVAEMQQEINPVIPSGLIGVAEDGVIEQVRQRGERAIKSCFSAGPPIGVMENQTDVLRCDRPNAGIFKQKSFVIKCEAC